MQLFWGILYFIIFPTVVSVGIHRLWLKEKTNIYIIFLYSCINWIFISGIKSLLGEYDSTILESFTDNGIKTYFHYIIPVLLIAIGAPKVVCFFCKRFLCEIDQLQMIVISSVFIFVVIDVIAECKVRNILIFLAGVVALMRIVALIFRKDTEISLRSEDSKRTIFLQTISIVAFWTLLIYIFIPGKIYVSNASEFHVKYADYVLTLIGGGMLVMSALSVGILVFLKGRLREIFLIMLFGFTVCCYLQQNFLNGKMQQLDGQSQAWSDGKALVNAILWFVILLVFFILSFKKKTLKVIAVIATYISLVLIFTLTYLSVSTDFSKEYNTATTVKMFELDDQNNTIVFVLDWFDEQILEQIVDEDEDFLDPLEGFTWYKNQTSRYSFTYMSIPYLLTGVEWKEGMIESDYVDYAYDNGRFISDISSAMYDIGIYSDSQMIRDKNDEIVNYSNGSVGRCKFWPTIEMMSSCSKYETMPFVLKNNYWYSTSDVNEMRYDGDDYDGDNEWFYSTMKNRGIKVSSDNLNGSFRFYHIWGVHDSNFTADMVNGPTDIKDCGRNVFRIVFEYIDMLKESGLYENATFIITADHGQNYLDDEDEEDRRKRNIRNTSNPILLVKKSGDYVGFGETEKAVSHENFFATVLNSMNIQDSSFADSYFDVEDDEKRVRYMDYYRYNDVPHKRYKIEGIATDENSWSVVD